MNMHFTRREFLKISGTTIALLMSDANNIFASISGIPVLLYHEITDKFNDEYTVSPSNFAAQMEWLYWNGYKSISIKDSINIRNSEKTFILTFDDGYRSFIDYAFNLLVEYNFKATINIIGYYVGTYFNYKSTNRPMLSWDEYRYLIKSGLIDLGCHSYNLHNYGRVLYISEEMLVKDLYLFQETLKKELGIYTDILAWPYGLYNKKSIELAKRLGFKYLLTSHEGFFDKKNTDEIPRLNINNKLDLFSFQEYIKGFKEINIDGEII